MILLRDVGWVAIYELGEAMRTRLFQLAILAYLGGIGFAVWLLTVILREMEAPLAAAMGLPPTDRPGALLNNLLADGSITDLLAPLAGGRAAAERLLGEPIAALWVGGAAMGMLPVVLLFTSGGTVSAELRSRSIRYLACRVDRLAIGLGKLVGQLALGGMAALLGVALAWILAMTLMVDNPPVDLAVGLATRAGWALAYALPWVGLGLAVSQWITNPNAARVVAGGLFVGMHVLAAWLRDKAGLDGMGRLADLGTLFLPPGLWLELWSTEPGAAAMAALRGAALAVVYYAIGHARFVRRDL